MLACFSACIWIDLPVPVITCKESATLLKQQNVTEPMRRAQGQGFWQGHLLEGSGCQTGITVSVDLTVHVAVWISCWKHQDYIDMHSNNPLKVT